MREHTNRTIRSLLNEAYRPYTTEYQDYLNGKGSLSAAGAQMDQWVRTYAHKDAATVRKVVKAVLDPLLHKKGLGVDFKRDKYTYWKNDLTSDYQVQPITKSLRAGSPGGDKLIEVQLIYYPNGREAFSVTVYGIDSVLGHGTYKTVKPILDRELDKAFPHKKPTDPNYDFMTDAIQQLRARVTKGKVKP
jgi:hypothetical protein